MSRYLGTVRILNTYVNFMPFYQLDYGELTKLTNSERHELFPDSEIPNINIFSSSEDRTSFAESFSEHQLYIVDLVPDLFEENFNYSGEYNRTRYKLNLDKLNPSQYGPIDQFDYYYYFKIIRSVGRFQQIIQSYR